MLIIQISGMCSTGSRSAENECLIHDDQEEKKGRNSGLLKGEGEEATTTSVMNARDWLLRTRLG